MKRQSFKMSFENCYISSSCNHTPSAAHWGKNNLICYGSCNAVFIYDLNFGGGKVIKTLHGHKKRVNCVKWIVGLDTELISGSTDGTAIVWSYKINEYIPFLLKGHEDIVNIVDGLHKVAENQTIVATGSVDSSVKIWIRLNGEGFISEPFIQIQSLNFGYGLCQSLRLTFLKCETLLLACGMDDSKIHFYVDDDSDGLKFTESAIIEGHQDWVRGLDFTKDDIGNILLASSSEALIQLFRIAEVENIDVEKRCIRTTKCNYEVTLESILTGHEGWIFSVNWHPTCLKLLSASIDKMLVVWEYDSSVNLWLETTKLGEIGGNTLGFYGAIFGPDGNSILAHSYHGAFHLWSFNKELSAWEPLVTVSGHYCEVVDLGWEPKGEFLVSASADQTTRIHAPWSNNKNEVTWHEIARPQVHGYDMNCLAILSRYKFTSGAEEKVIRAFNAPDNFIQNFRRICHIQEDELIAVGETPKGASVPSLGLSNKAVYDNVEQIKTKNSKDMYAEESFFTAVELTNPPTEETLIQNTLWPEVQKLYGHGYEVYSMIANHDGSVLASACKATSMEHAAILLWDTTSWKQIQKLVSHTLTVVQMAFSPDSNHLLSVSRDRRWSLFTRRSDSREFELVATTDKKTGVHTRIIWCCAWTHDSKYFATGSRDGKVVIWSKNDDKLIDGPLGQYYASDRLELKGQSVTALAFAPNLLQDKYLVAVGLESGVIFIYEWNMDWKIILTFDNSVAHHMTVKRLAFRPLYGKAGFKVKEKNVLQLASCSYDHSVRIFNIDVLSTNT